MLMKKLVTLILVLAGMVSSASADDLYLHNYNDTWGSYPTFTNEGVNSSGETVWSYVLNSTTGLNSDDFYFRLKYSDYDKDLKPWGDDDYTFNFDDANTNQTYTINQKDGDKVFGSNNAFCINHSKYKASEYKITVYAKKGTVYYVKAEILKMPVTIGSTGVATFSCTHALDFTGTGITANIITEANKATGVLTKVAKTQVPANTGLFLEGSAGTVEVPVLVSADAIAGNMLVAGPGTTVNPTYGDYTNFILTTNNGASATPKFFKVNSEGNEVAKGKAYLQILTTELNARSFFWFEDETTAIEAVKQEIKANGEFFNLAGQRVAQPTKGLYIVNGKKVIMK